MAHKINKARAREKKTNYWARHMIADRKRYQELILVQGFGVRLNGLPILL
jgi:hypothetical protein